jgi:hypothetical protein
MLEDYWECFFCEIGPIPNLTIPRTMQFDLRPLLDTALEHQDASCRVWSYPLHFER